jgi:hypothetical protein
MYLWRREEKVGEGKQPDSNKSKLRIEYYKTLRQQVHTQTITAPQISQLHWNILLASLDGGNGLADLFSGNESNSSSSVSKTDLQSWIGTGADWELLGGRARMREIRGSTSLHTSREGSALHVLSVIVSLTENALGVLRLSQQNRSHSQRMAP